MTNSTSPSPDPPIPRGSGVRSKLICALLAIVAIAAAELTVRIDPFAGFDVAILAICNGLANGSAAFMAWLAGAPWRPWYWVTGAVAFWGLCRFNATQKNSNLVVAGSAFAAAFLGSLLFFAAAPGYVAYRQGCAGILIGAATFLCAVGFTNYRHERQKDTVKDASNAATMGIIGAGLAVLGVALLWSYDESVRSRVDVSSAINAKFGAELRKLQVVSVSYSPPDQDWQQNAVIQKTTIVMAGYGVATHEGALYRHDCRGSGFDLKLVAGRYVVWSGLDTVGPANLDNLLQTCLMPIIETATSDRAKGKYGA